MGIPNKQFWSYWKKGEYENALNCSLEEENKEDRLKTMLFGNSEQIVQSGAVTSLSVGEFVYNYLMIDPPAVAGIDFARSKDLSSLFALNDFSRSIDITSSTGDAQLQGYVAEQMIAIELQAKGHDIEIPSNSNNPGWDLLVDGEPFQVKCLSRPNGVLDHFEKYPDIPVYVNEELAPYFEGHPNVYVSNISRDEVIEATTSTISNADSLLDFEIPLIAASVSSISNIMKVWKDDLLDQPGSF